ncbi:hypothetical protein DIPPA_08782 [Diplonema papillatum]|nr:hypothetical protein DIPPA_08782 [Diplonema papillatum]
MTRGFSPRPRPPEKRNPRLVFVDLERSGERELRRAMEQLTRALVGRLDACEKLQEKLEDTMARRSASQQTPQRRVEHFNRPAPAAAAAAAYEAPAERPRAMDPSASMPDSALSGQVYRAVFVSSTSHVSGTSHEPQQRAFLRFLNTVGHSPQALFLSDSTAPASSQYPHLQAVLEAMRWLCEGVAAGQRVIFHFVGQANVDGIFLSRHEQLGRDALADFIWNVPETVKATIVFDTGFGGTPVELPYSVVAHPSPAGFEMTTGEVTIPHGGLVLLLTTYVALESQGHLTAGIGLLTAGLLHVLKKSLSLTFRVLVSSLRDYFENTLGPASPMPLISSNRAFHPEGTASPV